MPDFPYSPQIWPDQVAGLLAALLVVFAWPRRFVRGGRPFIACQLVLFVLFLTHALVGVADPLPLKVLFYQAWMVAAVWGALAVLWFAVDYAGSMKRVSRWGWVLLALPLLILSGLIVANAVHGSVWSQFWDAGTLRSTSGVAGMAGMFYACVLASISLVILFAMWQQAHGVLRWQAALLVAGGVIIGIALVPEILRSPVIAGLGLSSILCTAGLLVAAVALLRFRAFDLAPVAHHALVEQTCHGMMVLDAKHRVVGLDPAARRLLAVTSWKVIGQDVRVVLGAWPELLRIVTDGDAAHTEITLNDGQDQRIFDASVSPLLDPTEGCTARLVLWLDVTELKAAHAEVDRHQSALAALTERERVGRELHDGLAQVLGYIKMQAQAAHDALERDCPDAAGAGLESIVAIAQDAHEEIQDFLLGARAAARANNNFWGAVTNFAERYSTLHDLKVHVSLPKDISELNVDPVTQVQLLRILQESLANVGRHAGASEANLCFARENGCLQVTVHDDGIGFDSLAAPSAKDGHYGLGFMRERAEEVGGRFEVISAPGQGTVVFVEVPIVRKDGSHATSAGR